MTEMTWKEVEQVHGTPGGIAVRRGRVSSLLVAQGPDGPYPNRIEADRMTYYVGESTSPEGVRALVLSVDSGDAARVFEKKGKNRWVDRGRWFVVRLGDRTSAGQIPFILYRAGTAGGAG